MESQRRTHTPSLRRSQRRSLRMIGHRPGRSAITLAGNVYMYICISHLEKLGKSSTQKCIGKGYVSSQAG